MPRWKTWILATLSALGFGGQARSLRCGPEKLTHGPEVGIRYSRRALHLLGCRFRRVVAGVDEVALRLLLLIAVEGRRVRIGELGRVRLKPGSRAETGIDIVGRHARDLLALDLSDLLMEVLALLDLRSPFSLIGVDLLARILLRDGGIVIGLRLRLLASRKLTHRGSDAASDGKGSGQRQAQRSGPPLLLQASAGSISTRVAAAPPARIAIEV